MILHDPPLSHLRYLIGGNPNGGTHFVASYLTASGYPCGHETLGLIGTDRFFASVPPDAPPFDTLRAVCSYTTGEYCSVPPADTIPILVAMRNPYHVLNSLIRTALLHGEAIDVNTIIASIVNRYERLWGTGRVALTFRVEYDMAQLSAFLNIPAIDPTPIPRARNNTGQIRLSWEDICSYPQACRLSGLATNYGYVTPGSLESASI